MYIFLYSYNSFRDYVYWPLKSIIDLFIHCRFETLKRLDLKMYTWQALDSNKPRNELNLSWWWMSPSPENPKNVRLYFSRKKEEEMLLFLERRREKGLMKEEAKEKIINTFQIVKEFTFSGVTHTPYKETGKKKTQWYKRFAKTSFSLS